MLFFFFFLQIMSCSYSLMSMDFKLQSGCSPSDLLPLPSLTDTDIRTMGKVTVLAKRVENQTLNVLLEHFVVSPEILCLKQRMFFVLIWGVGGEMDFISKKSAESLWITRVSTEMARVLHSVVMVVLVSFLYLKQRRSFTSCPESCLMWWWKIACWQVLINALRIKMLVIWKNLEIL